MARSHVTSSWKAVAAFLVFVLFAVALFYAALTRERLGGLLYVLAVAAIGLGMWSKQDSAAIGGIIGLNLLVVLDIALRIGILP